jgi:hypothetical protein
VTAWIVTQRGLIALISARLNRGARPGYQRSGKASGHHHPAARGVISGDAKETTTIPHAFHNVTYIWGKPCPPPEPKKSKLERRLDKAIATAKKLEKKLKKAGRE